MRSMRTVLCSQMDLTAPALTPTPSHCANGPLPTRRLEYCPQHSSILKRFRDAGRRHLSCRIVNSAVACRGGTIVSGTRGPRRSMRLLAAVEAYRHPKLAQGLDGCGNVAPGTRSAALPGASRAGLRHRRNGIGSARADGVRS